MQMKAIAYYQLTDAQLVLKQGLTTQPSLQFTAEHGVI